jgi:hypothetical protein
LPLYGEAHDLGIQPFDPAGIATVREKVLPYLKRVADLRTRDEWTVISSDAAEAGPLQKLQMQKLGSDVAEGEDDYSWYWVEVGGLHTRLAQIKVHTQLGWHPTYKHLVVAMDFTTPQQAPPHVFERPLTQASARLFA